MIPISIKIGNYDFDGPYVSVESLENKSGIYTILCKNQSENNYKVIDVGESAFVKTRIEGHDRKECWARNCSIGVEYAVFYTPNKQQTGRKAIEQELRTMYDPPCGER